MLTTKLKCLSVIHFTKHLLLRLWCHDNGIRLNSHNFNSRLLLLKSRELYKVNVPWLEDLGHLASHCHDRHDDCCCLRKEFENRCNIPKSWVVGCLMWPPTRESIAGMHPAWNKKYNVDTYLKRGKFIELLPLSTHYKQLPKCF